MGTANLLDQMIARIKRSAKFDRMSSKLAYKIGFTCTLKRLGLRNEMAQFTESIYTK